MAAYDPRERHRPIRVNKPERMYRQWITREPFIEPVRPVMGIQPVAVYKVRPLLAEREYHRIAVDLETKFRFQEASRPKVVVAANQMKRYARVAQAGEGAEYREISGEDNMAVLEPEIEEIAKANDAIEGFGVDTAQEIEKGLPMWLIRCGGLEMHIRE